MKKVDIKTVMSWNPCSSYTEDRIKKLFGRLKTLSVKQILDLDIPHNDKLWAVLRVEFFTKNELVLIACDFAEEVLPIFESAYPTDDRPRNAIAAARAAGAARAARAAGAAGAAEAAGAAGAAGAAAWAAGAARAAGAAGAAWAAAEAAGDTERKRQAEKLWVILEKGITRKN